MGRDVGGAPEGDSGREQVQVRMSKVQEGLNSELRSCRATNSCCWHHSVTSHCGHRKKKPFYSQIKRVRQSALCNLQLHACISPFLCIYHLNVNLCLRLNRSDHQIGNTTNININIIISDSRNCNTRLELRLPRGYTSH